MTKIDFSKWGEDHPADVHQLEQWASVLKRLIKEYPGRTIENVLGNIEARIKEKSNEK